MKIWITQGKDYEGTRETKLYRCWIASRAGRYRNAMCLNNDEEKERIVQEIKEEMEVNDAHLIKKKNGDWVEMEGQALDSAIKDSLRSVTKKKRKATNDGPVEDPAPLLSSAQLTPVYAQRYIPLSPSTTVSTEMTQALNTLLSSEDYEPLDYKPNNDTSQTFPSLDSNSSVSQHPLSNLFIPSLPTGPTGSSSHATREVASLLHPLSSKQQHRDSYLSLLEDSMYHLACSKIHEKELKQHRKPMICKC